MLVTFGLAHEPRWFLIQNRDRRARSLRPGGMTAGRRPAITFRVVGKAETRLLDGIPAPEIGETSKTALRYGVRLTRAFGSPLNRRKVLQDQCQAAGA